MTTLHYKTTLILSFYFILLLILLWANSTQRSKYSHFTPPVTVTLTSPDDSISIDPSTWDTSWIPERNLI